jgi:hypothetical protein
MGLRFDVSVLLWRVCFGRDGSRNVALLCPFFLFLSLLSSTSLLFFAWCLFNLNAPVAGHILVCYVLSYFRSRSFFEILSNIAHTRFTKQTHYRSSRCDSDLALLCSKKATRKRRGVWDCDALTWVARKPVADTCPCIRCVR